MKTNKHLYIFLVGISILITYAIILLVKFPNLSETIVSHINIKGETTSFGKKKELWIAIGVNFVLMLVILLSFKYPQIINFPSKPKEEAKLKVFNAKAKIWMAYLSVLVSLAFSSMIFYNLNYSPISLLSLLFLVVVLPIIIIEYAHNKKN